jgi:hypothetical protein
MVDPTVPSWAGTLSGFFAVQASSFSSTNRVVASHRTRLLAELRRSEAGTELIATSCEERSVSASATVYFVHPEKLGVRRGRVLFTADSFSTETMNHYFGYDAVAPPECNGKPGQPVAKRAFQTWITGPNCTCPGDTLPLVNDCRVTDPDDDKLPGNTAIGNAFNFGDAEVYGVSLSRTKFQNGKPSTNGGFVAQEVRTFDTLQYDCRPMGCFNLSGTTTTCAPEKGVVVFTPLAGRAEPAGGWTCPAVIQRAGELFPDPPPGSPSSCSN